jgi:hypothetical protein
MSITKKVKKMIQRSPNDIECSLYFWNNIGGVSIKLGRILGTGRKIKKQENQENQENQEK